MDSDNQAYCPLMVDPSLQRIKLKREKAERLLQKLVVWNETSLWQMLTTMFPYHLSSQDRTSMVWSNQALISRQVMQINNKKTYPSIQNMEVWIWEALVCEVSKMFRISSRIQLTNYLTEIHLRSNLTLWARREIASNQSRLQSATRTKLSQSWAPRRNSNCFKEASKVLDILTTVA